jgi:hypothetical protein
MTKEEISQAVDISYDMAANRYYAKRALVELPDGSTRTLPTAHAVPRVIKELTR